MTLDLAKRLGVFFLKALFTAMIVSAFYVFLLGYFSEGRINDDIIRWTWEFIGMFPMVSLLGAFSLFWRDNVELGILCWIVFVAGFFCYEIKFAFLAPALSLSLWAYPIYLASYA